MTPPKRPGDLIKTLRPEFITRYEYHNTLTAFAEIYVHDNATPQAIATGAGYTKSTAWGANGQELNCKADYANDQITITIPGIYSVKGSFSLSSGTANVTLLGSLFLGGVEQNQIHFQRKITTATDVGSMSFSGFIDVTAAATDVDFRMRHDFGGSVNITMIYGNLSVLKIGMT